MNRQQHFEAAERSLEEIETITSGDLMRDLAVQQTLALVALTHAVLATSELIPMPVPQSIRLCGCAFLPNQHIRGASCPPIGLGLSEGPGQTS